MTDAEEWVMVPREATEEMVQSAFDIERQARIDARAQVHLGFSTVYRAMLAASPTPPARVVTVEELEKAARAFDARWNSGSGWADYDRKPTVFIGWRANRLNAMRGALEALDLQVER